MTADPYAKLLAEVRRRQALHELRRRVLLVLAGVVVGVCVGLFVCADANAQSRPIGDPAPVRVVDVMPMIEAKVAPMCRTKECVRQMAKRYYDSLYGMARAGDKDAARLYRLAGGVL